MKALGAAHGGAAHHHAVVQPFEHVVERGVQVIQQRVDEAHRPVACRKGKRRVRRREEGEEEGVEGEEGEVEGVKGEEEG
jgi:hypothetical protein